MLIFIVDIIALSSAYRF